MENTIETSGIKRRIETAVGAGIAFTAVFCAGCLSVPPLVIGRIVAGLDGKDGHSLQDSHDLLGYLYIAS